MATDAKPAENARSTEVGGQKRDQRGGVKRKPASYHHGDLRRALIDGALVLIERQDVDALSLRSLATEIGVSYAAPYHHFRDKTALLAELAAEGFDALFALGERAMAQVPNDARERLEALGKAYINFATNRRSHYQLMFQQYLVDPERYPRTYDAGMRLFNLLLVTIQAVLEDQPEEIQRYAALSAWSAVHGFATLASVGHLELLFPDMDVSSVGDIVITALANSLQV